MKSRRPTRKTALAWVVFTFCVILVIFPIAETEPTAQMERESIPELEEYPRERGLLGRELLAEPHQSTPQIVPLEETSPSLLERLLERLLSISQHRLSRIVINIGAWFAGFSVIVLPGVWLFRKIKSHSRARYELHVKLNEFYLPVASSIEDGVSVDAGEAIKFYQGLHPDPLRCGALGFCGDREVINRLSAEQLSKPSRDYRHIHVCGESKQGKTMVLAALAQRLAAIPANVVLWHRAIPKGFKEISYLAEYAWLITPGWIGFWLQRFLGKRPRRLIIFVDDLFSSPGGEPTTDDFQFLIGLKGKPLVLITSSRKSLPAQNEGKESFSPEPLQLKDYDVGSIIKTFNETLQLTISREELMEDLGGVRGFDYDLASLMYQLLARCERVTPEFFKGLRDLTKDAGRIGQGLKYVAACETLELEVPENLVGTCLNDPNPSLVDSELKLGAGGWIVSKRLSYVENESTGLAFNSPFLAGWLLADVYGVSATDLRILFSDIITAVAKSENLRHSAIVQEFVRHIFQKLRKGRYFRFPGASGSALAQELFSKHYTDIQEIVNEVQSKSDIRVMCRWAWTASRIRAKTAQELYRDLCRKVSDLVDQSNITLRGADFVSLARALEHADEDFVRQILSRTLTRTFWQVLFEEEDDFRKNEIIHSYARLLTRKLKDFREALKLFESLRDTQLDAISMLERAIGLGGVQREKVHAAYQEAINRASSTTYLVINPTHLVKCHQEYAKFLCQSFVARDQAKEHFQKAYQLAYPDPMKGRGLSPDGVPGILCEWAECLKHHGDSAGAGAKYAESLQYSRRVLHPPLTHWKTIRGLAEHWLVAGQAGELAEVIGLLEEALNEEDLPDSDYDKGVKIYLRCWDQWLSIDGFDFKEFDRLCQSAITRAWARGPNGRANVASHLMRKLRDQAVRSSKVSRAEQLMEEALGVYTKLFTKLFEVAVTDPEESLRLQREITVATKDLSYFVTNRENARIPGMKNRTLRALELLKKVVEAYPANSEVWDGLVWVGSRWEVEEVTRKSLQELVTSLVTSKEEATEAFRSLRDRWVRQEDSRKKGRFDEVFPTDYCRELLKAPL